MRKHVFALLLFLAMAFATRAQLPPDGTYVYPPTQGIQKVYTAAASINAGELLVRNSSGQVSPVTAGATSGVIGVAMSNAQNGQTLLVGIEGVFPVSIDNSCTALQQVGISSTANGNGHCTASVSAAQLIGTAGDSTSGSTKVNISPLTSSPNIGSGGGGGAVSSVFGRTGAVTATNGDYSLSQITATYTAPLQLSSNTLSIASGSYANPSLSNLVGPTALNADLLCASAGSCNVGSSGDPINDLYIEGAIIFPITPIDWIGVEGAGCSGQTGKDVLFGGDSATHQWLESDNGGACYPLPKGVGTFTPGNGITTLSINPWEVQDSGVSAVPTWSSLTASANSNTGAFSMSQAGTFTHTAQNETMQMFVGTSTCPESTIIGGTTIITSPLSGCVNTPSSGVTNGFSVAVGGYIQVNDPNQGGQFGPVEGVAMYPVCRAAANNTHCIGAAPQVESAGSLTGVALLGIEDAVQPGNTGDTGYGILFSFEGGTVQPTSDHLPAAVVQTPTAAGTFTSGYECGDGSVSTGNCVVLGKTATGSGHNSQSIQWNTTNSAAVSFTASLALNQDDVLIATTPGFTVNNFAGEESYGILATATAAVAHGTLVKIDTAHADSFVICTTSDTSCDGVVQGTNSSPNGLCTVGSVACAIVTTPGSKVKLTLGTGTCSIGNYVIVDTTTNGDIKCTGSLPSLGAVIGKALSAQSTVGQTVDVLTKFE